jgi:hypothetical protein
LGADDNFVIADYAVQRPVTSIEAFRRAAKAKEAPDGKAIVKTKPLPSGGRTLTPVDLVVTERSKFN